MQTGAVCRQYPLILASVYLLFVSILMHQFVILKNSDNCSFINVQTDIHFICIKLTPNWFPSYDDDRRNYCQLSWPTSCHGLTAVMVYQLSWSTSCHGLPAVMAYQLSSANTHSQFYNIFSSEKYAIVFYLIARVMFFRSHANNCSSSVLTSYL